LFFDAHSSKPCSLAVIPPLIFDGDLRGLHDKAANTVVIRT